MLKQNLIDPSRYSLKCPYTMKPKGLCIHNTYNDASAENEIKNMKNNSSSTSFHMAVDDKEAIQGIPFTRNAWAAGDGNGPGNRDHIHMEICHSKSGGEKFNLAEARAAKEAADLCIKYGWDITDIKPHSHFAKKNCPHRTDMRCFLQAVQYHLDQHYKSNTPINKGIDGKIGIVTADLLNIRESSNANSNIVGKLKKGDKVKLFRDEGNGWYHIYLSYNKGGEWVNGAYVSKEYIKI